MESVTFETSPITPEAELETYDKDIVVELDVLAAHDRELAHAAEQLTEDLHLRAVEQLETLDLDEDHKAYADAEIQRIVSALHDELLLARKKAMDTSARIEWGAGMLAQLSGYRKIEKETATPEGLLDSNLDELRFYNRIEAMRESTLHTVLQDIHTKEDLRVFEKQYSKEEWGNKEFFEIYNRYRLLDAPEDEVRLFEESNNKVFTSIPRAREFYALALLKMKRPDDALWVCQQLVDDGLSNELVRGTMGDAYVAMHEREGISYSTEASDAYRAGFEDSLSSFCGLGWNEQTFMHVVDYKVQVYKLREKIGDTTPDPAEQAELDRLLETISVQEELMTYQYEMISVALEMEGVSDSKDYWAHAGALQLSVSRGDSPSLLQPIIRRALQNTDAGFKLQNTIHRLDAIGQALNRLPTSDQSGHYLAMREAVDFARSELVAGLTRFESTGHAFDTETSFELGTSEHLSESPEQEKLRRAEEKFLATTISSRALTGSLTPTYIPGGIGRTGGRVPDMIMNREDKRAFESIITYLGLEGESDPRTIKNTLEDYVRAALNIDHLQNLTDPDHHVFDTESEGGIELSGISNDMRVGQRSITNAGAALLLGIGDCRETMYIMLGLFATQQKMFVRKHMSQAMNALQNGNVSTYRRIMDNDIDPVVSVELRGQHASIYVEGMAINKKYDIAMDENNEIALQRDYGLDHIRSGQPMTAYELENSIIKVTYDDGRVVLIRPRDPESLKWRPLEHVRGCPVIPELDRAVAVSLLSLPEEHTLAHFHNRKKHTAEFADSFYDNNRHNGPYSFGQGSLDIMQALDTGGLMSAGRRTLQTPTGGYIEAPVHIEGLPYSTTDYKRSLGESDRVHHFRFLGRSIHADIVKELEKIRHDQSVFPQIARHIYEWQMNQVTS